jgi:hypothetical protein
MERLSSFAVDPVSYQLAVLNVLVAIYMICKGLNYVARTVFRRDPPKKSIRSEVARLGESKTVGR